MTEIRPMASRAVITATRFSGAPGSFLAPSGRHQGRRSDRTYAFLPPHLWFGSSSPISDIMSFREIETQVPWGPGTQSSEAAGHAVTMASTHITLADGATLWATCLVTVRRWCCVTADPVCGITSSRSRRCSTIGSPSSDSISAGADARPAPDRSPSRRPSTTSNKCVPRFGFDRWAVVGHSWGAELALRYAAHYLDRTTVVGYLSGIGAGDDYRAPYAAERERRLGEDLPRWTELGAHIRTPEEEHEWCVLQWRPDFSPGPAAAVARRSALADASTGRRGQHCSQPRVVG